MMSISHAECESTIGVEKNHLLVKCALCAKDMMLTDGSIIFGSKWYHGNCFDNIRSKQIFANESKIQRNLKNIGAD
ncbi:MAG: hypothetical protein AABZ37_02535 [Thermoproteota archaeon]